MATSSVRRVANIAALIVYLAMGIFPYLASALLAPPQGAGFLMLSWGIGLAAVLWALRRRSWWVCAAPILAAGYWAAVVTFGERMLGWTA